MPLSGSGVDEETPLVIPVSSHHTFYVPRQEFSVGMLLKNPMIIMLLISCFMFGMLKLFPEEELKESSKASREWQRNLIKKATAATDGMKEISEKKKK
ncbi:hypothetical protein STCU_02617 [Strigomonas culicis]|nr:hypothetical protein STCU_02617 [Strigomonas culicis]|eukprot:EPY32838.1 hypothetical protein STCU_02617 [Strigomonas culicis]